MQLLKIITAPNSNLLKHAQKVNVFDENLSKFAKNLEYTMNELDGCGLASIQVEDEISFNLKSNNQYRAQPSVIIVKPTNSDPLIAVNPEIFFYSNETNFEQEGCLSLPGKKNFAEVERSILIKVKYQNLQGEKINKTLENEAARIFQHECNHNVGIIFPNRLEKSRESFFWTKYMQRKCVK